MVYLVACAYLPKSFEFETVGEGIPFDAKEIPVLFDTVPRCLYQTQQLRRPK